MGLIGNIVSYKVGKSRGTKAERRRVRSEQVDDRDVDCINYRNFCAAYGNCDGMECTYGDD